MPYNIRERDGRYCVYKEGDDEPIGCHESRAEAEEQQRALYASENKQAELYRYTYNGVTVRASRRRSSSRDDKAWERTVSYDGNERTVHYADPDMPMRRTNDEARENFLSRHSCDEKKDPFAPGFWSCYDWANPEEKSMNEKAVYYVGSDVKLKQVSDTEYLVSGALVMFGDGIKTADFENDWFARDTDYDLDDDGTGKSTVYFNHGLDEVVGKSKIGKGRASLSKDDRAVWIEHHLDIANEYDAMVVELLKQRQKQGKSFGWSSGTAPHLVERELQSDGSYKITKWALGSDASITLIPNDWRQVVGQVAELRPTNIKSLITSPDETQEARSEDADASNSVADDVTTDNENIVQPKTKVEIMSDEQKNVTPDAPQNDEMKALQDKMAAQSAKIDEFLKLMENAPRDVVGGVYTVDGGTADPEIKNLGDFALAIKRGDHKRLAAVYGARKEVSTTDGQSLGYLIPDAHLAPIMDQINLTSAFPSLVRTIPVPQRSGDLPVRDYSVTPTAGSGDTAAASGITPNARAEGASYTEDTPVVSKIDWRVYDWMSGLIKASRELQLTVSFLQSWLTAEIGMAMASQKEAKFLRGNGAGQPLGILNADALISVTADTSGTFAVEDADEMLSRFQSIGGATPVWIVHPSVVPNINQMERGTGAGAFQANIANSLSTTLLGYPIIKSQHLAQLGANQAVVLADLRSYGSFEFGGMYLDYSEDRYFDTRQVAWRFGQETDGKPLVNSAITLAGPGSAYTVSPFVTLNDS